jgi:nitrile hydratase subunit beta
VFTGQELWGPGSDPAIKVSIEAFEPYLLPA